MSAKPDPAVVDIVAVVNTKLDAILDEVKGIRVLLQTLVKLNQ